MRREPCENAFLNVRTKAVETNRSFERERLRLAKQSPEFACFVRLGSYVGASGIAVQFRRNQKDGTWRRQGERGIEIERKARLEASEESETRHQSVQVRVVMDSFNAAVRCVEPQWVETSDRREAANTIIQSSRE